MLAWLKQSGRCSGYWLLLCSACFVPLKRRLQHAPADRVQSAWQFVQRPTVRAPLRFTVEGVGYRRQLTGSLLLQQQQAVINARMEMYTPTHQPYLAMAIAQGNLLVLDVLQQGYQHIHLDANPTGALLLQGLAALATGNLRTFLPSQPLWSATKPSLQHLYWFMRDCEVELYRQADRLNLAIHCPPHAPVQLSGTGLLAKSSHLPMRVDGFTLQWRLGLGWHFTLEIMPLASATVDPDEWMLPIPAHFSEMQFFSSSKLAAP